jgi:hypothetical protein
MEFLMKQINKNIFGKKYSFFSNEKFEKILTESIKSYSDFKAESADVDVLVGSINEGEALISRNPSIFFRYENSFSTDFGSVLVNWRVSDENRLIVCLSFPEHSAWIRQLSKLYSMEYSTDVEVFEQILHELVLVPSIYFFVDLIPIHSAAFSINGQGILLAGTGGTGKTSAMLALRNEKDVSFLSDDMTILSSDRLIYPNLAWPKIYGYNINNTNIKKDLLAGRGLVDRMHFSLRYKINPTKVRRKIRPEVLYQNVGKSGEKLSSIYLLFRDNTSVMALGKISSFDAVEMCLDVMKTEYAVFHKFLYWERFNSLAIGRQPLLDISKVVKNWRFHLRSIFDQTPVNLIKIPFSIPHEKYLDEIKKIVLS